MGSAMHPRVPAMRRALTLEGGACATSKHLARPIRRLQTWHGESISSSTRAALEPTTLLTINALAMRTFPGYEKTFHNGNPQAETRLTAGQSTCNSVHQRATRVTLDCGSIQSSALEPASPLGELDFAMLFEPEDFGCCVATQNEILSLDYHDME